MNRSQQIFYSLGEKLKESLAYSAIAGSFGYFFRQAVINDHPHIGRDEIARPLLVYAAYQMASYVSEKLGIQNKFLPYASVLGATALWEALEYTSYFQPVVQFLSLGPIPKGTVEDLLMDALVLGLIYFGVYKKISQPISHLVNKE